ncbi:MAG: uroporphyrinogen-III C-methyltransferase [Chloroflexi bacterium]|nr:uroporphyrinogen-III C-methyltransferase [Chloroflexota bacterium]
MTESRGSKVYLVGGGPGDPKLLTLRGVECLAMAQVVVYDRLIDPRLLRHAPADAERICVGKTKGHHTFSQDEINGLLVDRARSGRVVVRLKGGDPFVFGRGGEEAMALAAAGLPFEVVPGVTSAVAVPAYAGIPITHRHLTSSFTVVTGHEDPGKAESAIDWARLAAGGDTLVFLMGMSNLPQIVAELVTHGRAATTPVALIRWGTLPEQETVVGTLADIVERAQARKLGPPAVIVVGEVVALRERLRWFDDRPLFGHRVLVTRTREQASRLVALLEVAGARALEVPTIEVVPPADFAPLDAALSRLGEYNWVVYTSANGVRFFFERLYQRGGDVRDLKGVRLAAIGPATAATLVERGLRVDFAPDEYVAEAVVAGLGARGVRAARVLVPRAAEAREALVNGLRALGASVDEVAAYQTRPAPEAGRAKELLAGGEVDTVTFTSSSTVRNVLAALDGDISLLQRVTIACIGPITAQTAREAGVRVDVVAAEHTVAGLVEALISGR